MVLKEIAAAHARACREWADVWERESAGMGAMEGSGFTEIAFLLRRAATQMDRCAKNSTGPVFEDTRSREPPPIGEELRDG
jgi:hypothetical protein